MYLISLPLLDFTGHLGLDYAERLDMIKRSLLFKSCRRNTVCSCLLVFFEAFSLAVFLALLQAISCESIPFVFIIFHIGGIFPIQCLLNYCIYRRFDQEDYRNRAAGILNEEIIERLENVLNNEDFEDSHEISVPTRDLIKR